MRRRFFPVLVLPIVALAALPLRGDESDASRRLHELFRSEWEWTMEQNPTWASSLGDRRWNDRWEDIGEAAIEARSAHEKAVLEKLLSIDRATLSAADKLNAELFEDQVRGGIEDDATRWHLVRIDQMGGLQTVDELGSRIRMETRKDFEDWIARCERLPMLVRQTAQLMRQGMKEKVLLPKVILGRVPAQLDKQIVEDPSKSPFFKPFESIPASIADAAAITSRAKDAIAKHVVPSFRGFKKFFVEEYLPACFDQVGVWQVPNGDRVYARMARRHTTTTKTPAEIHELGLAEVKRIRGEMERVRAATGFKGTHAQFVEHLRTDKRFFCSSPAELLDTYRALTRRVDPRLVKLFGKLPRTPYGVEPIPDKIAPDTTTAYYHGPAPDGSRAGTYYVNLYRPEVRPKWEMMALSLHEAVPGHHLQIALAVELEDVPEFRKHGGWTAYVEGWGLYAESLGEDMGLYDDPYSKFGQLTYEMWRAVRLVVDTGMHSLRWDRKKAIDFFLENCAKPEHDVVNEIDRYIAWPGQALAYKVGELKLHELRARAKKTLGEKFDIREFHDLVLGAGALPLGVLERRVDAWLARKTERQYR